MKSITFFVLMLALVMVKNVRAYEIDLQILTQQSNTIWGFDFLPDGNIVFTEKTGALKILNSQTHVECTNGKIYTGITTDIQRRFEEHLNGTGAKFTRANPPLQILTFKPCVSRSKASSIEYHVKRLKPLQNRELAVIWSNV